MDNTITKKCNEFRNKLDNTSETIVEFDTIDFEATLSYSPQENIVEIFVIPSDFQFSSGKEIIEKITNELDCQYKGIKSSDAGKCVEFKTSVNWKK